MLCSMCGKTGWGRIRSDYIRERESWDKIHRKSDFVAQ